MTEVQKACSSASVTTTNAIPNFRTTVPVYTIWKMYPHLSGCSQRNVGKGRNIQKCKTYVERAIFEKVSTNCLDIHKYCYYCS